MTEPLNEERAREIVSGKLPPLGPNTCYSMDAAQELHWIAAGYLRRVEQTKAVLEAADRIKAILKEIIAGEPITPKVFSEVAIACVKYDAARAKLDRGVGE